MDQPQDASVVPALAPADTGLPPQLSATQVIRAAVIAQEVMVDVVNECDPAVLHDDEVVRVCAALAKQIGPDSVFSKVWGTTMRLRVVPRGVKPDPASWWMPLLPSLDVADAFGYHDLTVYGKPIMKVDVVLSRDDPAGWPVTASHEAVEAGADPYCSLSVMHVDGHTLVALENADPCEADAYGYKVDGITLSDFVFPAYFHIEPAAEAGPKQLLDRTGSIKKPFEILPGGYMSVLDLAAPASGWHQINARIAGSGLGSDPMAGPLGTQVRRAAYKAIARVGSRRERRARGRANWILSSPPVGRS